MGRLRSHTLTVTQLEFSHDNNFLLSVSRDRHFSIFAIKQTGMMNFFTWPILIMYVVES